MLLWKLPGYLFAIHPCRVQAATVAAKQDCPVSALRLSLGAMRTLVPILLLLIALPATAQVYRWVDKEGVVHYADKPQTPDAKPAELPKLQALTPREFIGGTPQAASTQPAPAETTSAAAPIILTPAPNETIRDAELRVNISVGDVPPPGQAYVYYVDGAAQNSAPSGATSWTATGIERGSHQASVAVVDGQGAETARSAPVTFFMKPPDINMVKRANGH
jgi:hypothetical protein